MATSDADLNSSTSLESESDAKLLCSPCQNNGKRLEAAGCCVTCKEFLCEWCFKCHKVPSLMWKHRLLDKEQMLNETGLRYNTSKCTKHDDEDILYHCPTHSFMGCHICLFHHQKTCQSTKYIPDVSKTITSSEIFTEFRNKLDSVAEKSKSLVHESQRKIALVEQSYTRAVGAIKQWKLEVLEEISNLEKDLYEKAEKFKRKEISTLKSVLDKSLHVETEHQTITSEIQVLQNKNQNGELYVCMIKSKDKLLSLEDDLQAAHGINQATFFKFEANEDLRETLKSPFGLGKLRKMQNIVKAEHVNDINVKHQDDKGSCCITGSVIMPDNVLVVADNMNKKIKIINYKRNKILSTMTLTSSPWSLNKVAETTVAVCLPSENKVVFARIYPALSVDKEIRVGGSCYGVAYSDGKLVVGISSPPVLEIIDVHGSVLKKIETDNNGEALFSKPYHVAINHEHSLIYVSNHTKHNVVCLRFDGSVVATYRDNELQYPLDVIADNTGNVFVCSYDSRNIQQLTEDCIKVKVLLTNADGLGQPYTISYDERESKFYVGFSDNVVKVFQLTYELL